MPPPIHPRGWVDRVCWVKARHGLSALDRFEYGNIPIPFGEGPGALHLFFSLHSMKRPYRVDAFEGTKDQYITYLELEVRNLRGTLRNHGSMTLPGSTVGVLRNDSNLTDAAGPLQENNVHETGDLAIVQWDPSSKRIKRETPTWKRHAAKLIEATPKATEWWQALRQHGIYEIMHNGTAIAHLLSEDSRPVVLRDRSMRIQEILAPSFESSLVQHIALYARSASQHEEAADVLFRLANFQKFLVLSACSVVRVILPNIPDLEILHIVQICVGQHSSEYSDRMLRVAVYLNTLIDILNVNGWDGRAAELVLLCTHFLQRDR